MMRWGDVFFLLCCMAYVFLSRLFYVQFGAEVMMLTFVLVALGAYLYGTIGGLSTLLVLLPYNYFVCEWLRGAGISWPEYGYRIVFILICVM